MSSQMRSEFGAIADRLEALLDEGKYDSDRALAARLYLALAEEVQAQFDDQQRHSLAVARRFWRGEVSEAERLQVLKAMWDRQDAIDRHDGPQTTCAVLNRAALAPLVTVGGFSHQAGDLIVELAEGLKIPVTTVDQILADNIPDYRFI